MATSIPKDLPSAQEQNIDALFGQSSSALTAWHRACALAADTLSAQSSPIDTGFPARLAKGLALAQGGHVTLIDGIDLDDEGDWANVQSGRKLYPISTQGSCSCPYNAGRCKHLLAVDIYQNALTLLPGQTPVGEVTDTSGSRGTVSNARTPRSAGVEESGRPDSLTTRLVPTSPSLQIENPAGANFKARIGNAELWYTWHGATDAEVTARMRETLPFLQEIVEACEAQHARREEAARQQAAVKAQAAKVDAEAAKAAPAPQAPLELAPDMAQLIARAVQEALAAHTLPASSANGVKPPARQEEDPSVCAKHGVNMRWHPENINGPGWYSHQIENGKYCKGARG